MQHGLYLRMIHLAGHTSVARAGMKPRMVIGESIPVKSVGIGIHAMTLISRNLNMNLSVMDVRLSVYAGSVAAILTKMTTPALTSDPAR